MNTEIWFQNQYDQLEYRSSLREPRPPLTGSNIRFEILKICQTIKQPGMVVTSRRQAAHPSGRYGLRCTKHAPPSSIQRAFACFFSLARSFPTASHLSMADESNLSSEDGHLLPCQRTLLSFIKNDVRRRSLMAPPLSPLGEEGDVHQKRADHTAFALVLDVACARAERDAKRRPQGTRGKTTMRRDAAAVRWLDDEDIQRETVIRTRQTQSKEALRHGGKIQGTHRVYVRSPIVSNGSTDSSRDMISQQQQQ